MHWIGGLLVRLRWLLGLDRPDWCPDPRCVRDVHVDPWHLAEDGDEWWGGR